MPGQTIKTEFPQLTPLLNQMDALAESLSCGNEYSILRQKIDKNPDLAKVADNLYAMCQELHAVEPKTADDSSKLKAIDSSFAEVFKQLLDANKKAAEEKHMNEYRLFQTAHGYSAVSKPGELNVRYTDKNLKRESQYADSLWQLTRDNLLNALNPLNLPHNVKNVILDFVATHLNLGTSESHKDFAVEARKQFGNGPITIKELNDPKVMDVDFSPRGSGLIGGCYRWIQRERFRDMARECYMEGVKVNGWEPSPKEKPILDAEKANRMANRAATPDRDTPAVEVGALKPTSSH